MIAYTHVGRKPNVAYQSRGRMFGHSSFKAGKNHALNSIRGHFGPCYRSVCGEIIDREYESECGQYTIRDHVKPASEGIVTCKRCLAMIQRKEGVQ